MHSATVASALIGHQGMTDRHPLRVGSYDKSAEPYLATLLSIICYFIINTIIVLIIGFWTSMFLSVIFWVVFFNYLAPMNSNSDKSVMLNSMINSVYDKKKEIESCLNEVSTDYSLMSV